VALFCADICEIIHADEQSCIACFRLQYLTPHYISDYS